MKKIYFVYVTLLVFMFCFCADADIVHLKDGRRITGKVAAHNENVIEIDIGGGNMVTHNMEEVERIEETAENIVPAPKEKSGLEKFIDGIKRKVETYFRNRRRIRAIKEMHDLRVKEYEFRNKQKAAENMISMPDAMKAAQDASMAAHNAKIRSMKAISEAIRESER